MKLVIILSLLIEVAYANEGGSHDSHVGASSLISSFVNLGLLLSFMVWKLRTPMRNMFNKKAEDIKTLIDRSESKAKEAEMLMQAQAKKMAGADEEVKNIENGTDAFIKSFEDTYNKEVDERIVHLKLDAEQKIEAEKKDMITALNTSLLDQVIASTKKSLNADASLSSDASKKLLERI